jgi:hypothetical protein
MGGNFMEETVLRDRMESELAAGEELRWFGRAIPKRLAWTLQTVSSSLLSLVFLLCSLAWTLFGVLQPVFSSEERTFSFFPLIGLVFAAFCAVGALSPYLLYRRGQKTAYAVTNRRAMILQQTWRGEWELRSFRGDEMNILQRRERSDKSGDVFFREEADLLSQGNKTPKKIGFVACPEVQAAEKYLRQLRNRYL